LSFSWFKDSFVGVDAPIVRFIVRNQGHRADVAKAFRDFEQAFPNKSPSFFCFAALQGLALAQAIDQAIAVHIRHSLYNSLILNRHEVHYMCRKRQTWFGKPKSFLVAKALSSASTQDPTTNTRRVAASFVRPCGFHSMTAPVERPYLEHYMSFSKLHDVVIAGAGPVGLFLSCELALAGLDVLIVERAESPQTPLKLPPLGMRGISVATGEALYRRGLLDDLVAAADAARAAMACQARGESTAKPTKAQVGHFAGIPINPALVDLSKWTYRLPNPVSANFAADMASVEAVLTKRAQALGVEIRRGLTVTGVCDESDQVTIDVGDLKLRARWLVGCDGGHSSVRKLAGFDFPGTEPEFTAYYALVDIADPHKLLPGRNATPSGFYMNLPGQLSIADFDGGAFDRSNAITLDHLQSVLRRVSETDVTLTAVHLATSFTDRARLATSYRRGHVLLAGDAAHIHSALGGQGLNIGMGDAMNLGWKLAATVLGKGSAQLLDTYETERRPIGQWVLDWTRAQACIMKPTPQAKAVEGIVRDLIDTGDGATYFAEQLWGITLHYDLGSKHPLVGYSAPDLTFQNGDRLAEYLHAGTGVLINLAGDKHLRVASERWRDQIKYVESAAQNSVGLSAALVRPDGFVAWAADGEIDFGAFDRAIAQWFGAPALTC
jgi:pentachlorophenol monooxygenase